LGIGRGVGGEEAMLYGLMASGKIGYIEISSIILHKYTLSFRKHENK
jgi:hypothetical protein